MRLSQGMCVSLSLVNSIEKMASIVKVMMSIVRIKCFVSSRRREMFELGIVARRDRQITLMSNELIDSLVIIKQNYYMHTSMCLIVS